MATVVSLCHCYVGHCSLSTVRLVYTVRNVPQTLYNVQLCINLIMYTLHQLVLKQKFVEI